MGGGVATAMGGRNKRYLGFFLKWRDGREQKQRSKLRADKKPERFQDFSKLIGDPHERRE